MSYTFYLILKFFQKGFKLNELTWRKIKQSSVDKTQLHFYFVNFLSKYNLYQLTENVMYMFLNWIK